jgi:cyclopropane fatty-acyl-phospholipid synthase-like methyltransferase
MAEDPRTAQWNERYSSDDYIFGEAPNRFLESHAASLEPGQKALMVADGEGRNGVFLAKRGLDVLSVDFSPVALGKLRKLAARAGVAVATKEADLLAWDWGRERFDAIVAIFIQFGPAEREIFFAKLKDALKPGGLVMLEAYTPKQLEYRTGGPPVLDHLYTADMLRQIFAGYDMVELREHDAAMSEGRRHSGMSALVDLIARKPARKG